MSGKKNIFPKEIELSEIVLKKTNQAFEMIKQEENDTMKKSNFKGKKLFKTQAAAIAGVCILGISGISAAAAIHHYWGRGMNGNIKASENQQQELTEKGIAKVYRENPEYESLAITQNGIKITPDTVLVDERYAYLSFHISDYHLENGAEPGFESVEVYQGDNPENAGSWVNMSGSMYDGIVSDENGMPVYEDGSSIEKREDGSIISHYMDDEGNMEYIIKAAIAHENDSLTGKKIHVNFKNLGTFSNAQFTSVAEGDWNFELNLSEVSSTEKMEVGKKVEGTGFEIKNIDISPISIKINYAGSGALTEHEDETGIPEVKGVVLKDGTKIPYLIEGSMTGYTDNSRTCAYQMAGFERVIDVDEVAALIVLPAPGKEMAEIPLSK